MTIKETPGETPFLYFPRFSFSPTSFLPSFPAGSAQSLPVPGVGDLAQGAGAGAGLGWALLFYLLFLPLSFLFTHSWHTHRLQSLRCVPALPWSLQGEMGQWEFLEVHRGKCHVLHLGRDISICQHSHGGPEQSCRGVCPDGP